ncbi:MAG: glycerophosphodiester phosphodiesterase, partial [Firmicutes bacterium]|nr:glycerophosphodiester phosphodiesterase [Bacillota bacterium]
RGLHTEDKKIPENSLAAFDAACRKGYGSELDVQLSADGKVFVFHDDTLDRVTGVPGVAEEYPWDYLSRQHLCGTDETIPLFEDVLDTVDGRTPLIVEFKSTERYPELCEKALDLLLEYRERTGGEFCVESFDPRIVRWFKLNAPTIVRGQLSAPTDNLAGPNPTRLWKAECFVCAHLLENFLTRPHFIAYRVGPKPLSALIDRALGAPLVVWTSLDPKEEETADVVIFQFYEPKPQYQ